MSEINEMIKNRGAEYGEYSQMCYLIQDIKGCFVNNENWNSLTAEKKEALEMIATKIGRIINGNPDNIDSWTDIIGYCTIVLKTIRKEHSWVMVGEVGMYDTNYKCTKCSLLHTESSDNPESVKSIYGCIS